MPIATTRLEEGILYTKSTGPGTIAELNDAHREGLHLLQAAGDTGWVLIMDVSEAGTPSVDMNKDTLRTLIRNQQNDKLAGYVVLGAAQSARIFLLTYCKLFRLNMHFEMSFESALIRARAMRDSAKPKDRDTP